jgi:DNA polymerase-3 subunit gamma/tau
MSYLVLARKYRPQRFADLAGQEHIAITLRNQILAGRPAHAYLFTGPRGTGKTSAARILAKALRCEDRQPDGEPCNRCSACLDVNSGASMDVLEIDAASNTGVDNIRDLRENVNYMATSGQCRIYIVDEVHMLSTAAFNAFLKTLEEPPPHVYFIFATTDIHKVPATIVGRCQRFDFRRIPADIMTANLRAICQKEGVSIEDGALAVVVSESEGCLRDAQSLLDQAIAFSGKEITSNKIESILGLLDRGALFEIARAIGNHDPATALSTVHQTFGKGTDPKVLLARLVEFLSDLHFKMFTGKSRIPDAERDQALQELCEKLSQDEVVRAMDLAIRSQAQLTSALDGALALESLIVKLCLQRPFATAAIQQTNSPNRSTTIAAPTPRAPTPPSSAPPITRPTMAPRTSAPQNPPQSSPANVATESQDSNWTQKLATYIRNSKPAWTPVLSSVQSIENTPSGFVVQAKADFAGKRLASQDGIQLLKIVFNAQHVVVQLSEGSKGPSFTENLQAKRTAAREHPDVKSALKIFDGTISETKVLHKEDE